MRNKQDRCVANRVARLILGIGVSSMLLLPSIAMAQADPTADETIWGGDSGSVSGDNGAAASLMDMIQRGQVGPTQSRAEFLKNQDANLNDAAAAFRRSQLEALKTPASSASQPEGDIELEETEDSLQSQTLDPSPRRALW